MASGDGFRQAPSSPVGAHHSDRYLAACTLSAANSIPASRHTANSIAASRHTANSIAASRHTANSIATSRHTGNSVAQTVSSLIFDRLARRLKSLPTEISEDLLRAVPVSEVLNGFGKHWQASAATAEDYNCSTPVHEMDDFISHDWGTPRMQKVLSLYFLYNGRIAILSSSALALPLGFLGNLPEVPAFPGNFAKIVCPLVYFLMLFFGHHLSGLLGRSKQVFLDKLCIHQVDEARKTAGILSLAGFLRSSKRLVVLWSPRYFSRLWCTYELAAWAYLHGLDAGRVCLLPVSFCIVRCQILLTLSAVEIGKSVVWHSRGLFGVGFASFVEDAFHLWTIVFLLLAFPVVHKSVAMLRKLRLLEDQARSFSIRDSKCFCCTYKHAHPATGQPVPCDRKLVYATFHQWHAEASTADAALDDFDETVRSDLCRMLTTSMNTAFLCFRYRDLVSCCIPVLWSAADYLCYLCRIGSYMRAIRWLSEYSLLVFCLFPLTVAAVIKTSAWTERMADGFHTVWVRRFLCSCMPTISFLASFIFLWWPGQLLMIEQESVIIEDVLLVSRFVCLFLVTLHVIRPRRNSKADLQVYDTEQARESICHESESAPWSDVNGRKNETMPEQECHTLKKVPNHVRWQQNVEHEETSETSDESALSTASL
eukprot:TRINITY_DN7656_c0_g1_i2.p1 TRINITY_DN7656_c0_g1~~TRINITY_DN7656_c0_g1_i2.p1  ORF type:complete len:654 (+),score=15.85 TRINITY_DN7656_c0_g1_i2:76-2037(+)